MFNLDWPGCDHPKVTGRISDAVLTLVDETTNQKLATVVMSFRYQPVVSICPDCIRARPGGANGVLTKAKVRVFSDSDRR